MAVTSAAQRRRMVRELRSRGIVEPRVLETLGQIPRDEFVQEALRGKAYDDASLPIGENQTISQPWIVARMCELTQPDGTGKVLEIGTGSGYHAAVLSRLFELVYSVERIAAFSKRARETVRNLGLQNIHFKIFDGSYGWSEFAPYRAVLVTAAVPEVPRPLIDQLEEGGRLIIPLGNPAAPDEQILTRVIRRGDEVVEESHGACRFVPLVGKYGWDA